MSPTTTPATRQCTGALADMAEGPGPAPEADLVGPPDLRTTLRDYQQRGLAAARAAYRAGARAILLVSPTGSGKTRLGVELCRRAIAECEAGARLPATEGPAGVLWIAHRTELIEQARDRLLSEGVARVGLVAHGRAVDREAGVVVASLQTLVAWRRRGRQLPRARVVVFDEAHHVGSAGQWGELASSFEAAVIFGLTATPVRADGRPMGRAAGGLFEALVVVAQVSELQALGYLVPVDTIRPPAPQGQLAAHPVAAYLEHGAGGLAFCFCATIAHAEQTASEFHAAGVPSAVIDAKTKPADRAARLSAFKGGSLKVLCNVFALTEGVDIPAASVCIFARGVGSAAMYVQGGGRVLRPAPGKTRALILDLRGAVYQHDFVDSDRAYSLDDEAMGRAKNAPPMAIATCLDCGAVYKVGPVKCPRCGAESPPLPMPVVKLAQLGTVGRVVTMAEKRTEYARLRDEGVRRGRLPGWAAHKYRSIFGVWPRGVK